MSAFRFILAHSDQDRVKGPRAPLALLLVPLLIGIILDRWLDIGLSVWCAGSSLALLGSIVSLVARSTRAGTLMVCLLAAGVGGTWHHAFWNFYPADHIAGYACEQPRPVCCRARVVGAPKIQLPPDDPLQPFFDEERTRMLLEMTAIRTEMVTGGDGTIHHVWKKVSGRAPLFVTGGVRHVKVGDRIQVFAKLARLTDRRNPGGYSALESGRRKRAICRLSASHTESLTIVEHRRGVDPRWWLEVLHEWCRTSLMRYLDEDAAQLAAAVLLGDREYLDQHQVDSFFVTGTVHLLAISGLHLAIIVRGLFLIARTLTVPRRTSLYLVMMLSLLYAAMTGARPPVLRATVLVWMLCIELLYFRPRFSFNSLAAAGLVIVMLNPTSVFDAGVQLSFLAVGTLIWIARFERAQELAGLRREMHVELEDATLWPYLWGKLRQRVVQTIVAGCAIWFVSIPLVMHRFHLVPVSGLALNLFLMVPLAAALYCGLLVIFFSWCPPVAHLSALGCEICLAFITTCVNWAEGFEIAYGWVAGPTFAGLCLFYVVLLGFGAFQRYSSRWPAWVATAFAALILLALIDNARLNRGDKGVECAFLSVGHGVCTVLQLPDGETWLYDAGSLGATRSTLREVSAFLWSRGITRLDGIVLSHGDIDHFNVVPALVERFDVDEICASPAMFRSPDGATDELRYRLDRQQVPVRFVASGSELAGSAWGSVTVRYPSAGDYASQDNANSVVLDISYYGKRILLTGDLEGEGLAQLLATEPLDCDIVMAPHHGSRHSRPEDVAEWCRPEWVVVSGGDPERSHETANIYRQAGAKVLHTGQQGAVTAILRPDRVLVTSL